MGIFDIFKKDKPVVYYNIKSTRFEKELKQPKESTKEKGEKETTGKPNYELIDKLAKYDPTIDGASYITVAAILSSGYTFIHENENLTKEVNNLWQHYDIDQSLADWLVDFYKYGTSYINIVIENGSILKLQKVPPHYVDRAVGMSHVVYETAEGEELEIERNYVVMLDFLKNRDYLYPKSIFEAGLELLEDEARMNDQFRILIEEYVAPMIHAKIGGTDFSLLPSQEEIDDLAEKIENTKTTGVDITTDQLVDIAYIQPDRGLNVTPFLDFIKQKILLLAMVPESYKMHRSPAAAGGDSARQVESFHNWIRMLRKSFIEPTINKHLIPMLLGEDVYDEEGNKLELDYSKYPRFEFNPLQEWKLKELNYEIKLLQNNLLEPDEFRKEHGMKPLGDERIEWLASLGKGMNQANEFDEVEEKEVRIDEEKGE